ncbi:MFS transporter [Thiolapillus sp.]|uniref:MFS transporter n=1 Tax=Thiolapillus sp. TaxID=2017437 RepID=UPI0025ECEE80|nr:MFS transporter [Thiolapillus sp.]
MFSLPKTVIILGLVSFLNDTASEMITPLLPLFLTATLGAGPAIVGLIEGVAEATASLLKLASGRLVDRGWNHKRLVLGGYSVSNLARPLIGVALGWTWVLILRFLDRVGKGIRTSPRDALIAASTNKATMGRSFGFHRALDNAGAMVGPLLAFGLLSANLPLQHVFLWSLIPGLLVLALLIWGLDGTTLPVENADRSPWRWSMLDRRVRSLIIAAGGLALASAPEAFLVLWANDRGLAIAWVPLVWAGASAVKAIVAGPAGALSDYFGRVPLLLAGWGLRIALLIALAFTAHGQGEALTWTLFLLYGGALAMTEGVERALIGDFSHASQRGTAFGLYHMTTGLAALPGALLFGVLWQGFGAATAFVIAAIIAALSTFMLLHSTRTT